MQRTSTVPISALDWFAIPAADFDRALRFYEAILEAPMRVGDFGGEKIAVFPHDEVGPGGAVVPGIPSATGTIVYLSATGRLDRALALVAAAGGRIETPRTALPDGMGDVAHIIDTEGNRVGLHANP
jgi:predicted enzyme related to lactoylglutathione lyase